MPTICLLSDEDVRQLVPLDVAIDLVEAAFRADAEGNHRSFPVVRTAIEDHEGIFGIKSGRLLAPDTLGLKAGGYWRSNPMHGELSAHQSTILLFDPRTGRPEAMLRANYVTEVRTAAAGVVAASALARPGARTVTVFGAGRQAHVQVQALALRFPLERVFVVARRPEAALAMEDDFRDAAFDVQAAVDPRTACAASDIIVTTTPSFEPVLHDDWVPTGCHVNAVGSDTQGKGELDARLLERARFFADASDQSKTLGEGQRLGASGAIVGTLGEVLAGTCPGRVESHDVTVFDSTGVTFQDLVVARHALDRARSAGLGREVRL